MKRSLPKRSIALCALALAAVPLSACVEDGYTYGMGMTWRSYPYDVWYDGYYGPLYDGYWGTDGYFYYRLQDNDRHYRRGDNGHFRREPRYKQYDGHSQEPPHGTRMPNYPRDGYGDHRDDGRHR